VAVAGTVDSRCCQGDQGPVSKHSSGLPEVSIVIPTKNEAEDIVLTLESCLALDYPSDRVEIIVVDDSTDDTPEIVKRFAGRGVRLIHREKNSNGCCGARNEGMRAAHGEIVVLLNADAVPSRDFLARITEHYRRGADYVIVRSTVMNQEVPWGRLIEAEALQFAASGANMEWSEGFSCRREAALAAGLIPGDFPVPFCRDWRLGAALSAAGFRKVTDLTIQMRHIVPGTFGAYWRHSIWRGGMLAPTARYFGGRSVGMIALREILRAVRALTLDLLVMPGLVRALRLTRFSSRGRRDLLVLWAAAAMRDLGVTMGCFRGVLRIARVNLPS
jgi:Glycosyl transferase family 2